MEESELRKLVNRARERFEAMTPEEQAQHRKNQQASWVRGMTTPCEHGVLDFEQCPACRGRTS